MVRGGRTRVLWLLAIALTTVVCWSATAWGAFGVSSFDGAVTADPSGDVSYAQAGGHPYAVSTTIGLNTKADPVNGDPWPDEPVKDLIVDVPPGLIGNTTVPAQCTMDQLIDQVPGTGNPATTCPPASQVGFASTSAIALCISGSCIALPIETPVFNMTPPPGVPARFGMKIASSIVTFDATLRGSDYGLSVKVGNINSALPLLGSTLTLWGVPADPSHTSQRICPGQDGVLGCAAGVPEQAFLRMPTSCSGPQTSTLHADSWFHPGDFETATFVSHQTAAEGGAPQGTTGCDAVQFDPTFSAQPDSTASPGPAGWTFDIRVPQDDITDPAGITQGDLKKAVVTLPAGVRISPSAADGLAACSPAQIDLHSSADPHCPDASKIGRVAIDTPLLDEQLTGSVYLATPHDNPSRSLTAMYVVAKGGGVTIKLAGSVTPNQTTGQLTATLDNLPQTPFSRAQLEFFGGPRAALSNPTRCGTYTTKSVMTSWSGKTVTQTDSFTTSHDGHGAPCPRTRFAPAFTAGTVAANDQAPPGGSTSSFRLTLARGDDDEELGAISSVELPDGLLAKIATVPLCAPVRVAAGTCGAASRIGSVTAAAGPGPDPFAVDGRIYLGGPYKGAPFSLSIVVPAIAGPFDLGTIVVRGALDIDRRTAKAEIRTDPLPTILQGIPLQVRWVSVDIDRRDFIVNPTSCDPTRIGATAVSTAGTVAHVSSRFKVVDCARLALTPKMRLTVGAKGRTRKGASVPLSTTLTQPPGQSGLEQVSVTLPSTLNARLPVVNNACTEAEFEIGHCEDARAGSAVAVTPLLKHALRGGAYFVKDPDRPQGSLPNLIIALRGQVAFDLVGTVKIPHGTLLSTRFTTVPDVPIKRFTLRLVAGSHGPLGAAANLCTASSRRRVAHLTYRGQNGRLLRVNQPLEVKGCRATKRG